MKKTFFSSSTQYKKSELMLMRRARAYNSPCIAGNLGLSPSISSQFTLLQPKIAKESLKINIFRVQGHSRSSMLTFLRSSSPVLVMISSISVPINHLHVRRANNGRVTPFKGVPLFLSPRSWGPPSPSGMKCCHKILQTLSYQMVKTKSLYLTWASIGTGL